MTEHTPMKEETASLLHAVIIIREATHARRATRPGAPREEAPPRAARLAAPLLGIASLGWLGSALEALDEEHAGRRRGEHRARARLPRALHPAALRGEPLRPASACARPGDSTRDAPARGFRQAWGRSAASKTRSCRGARAQVRSAAPHFDFTRCRLARSVAAAANER